MDDDDDIYPENEPQTHHNNQSEVKMEDIDYDEEEGEEVEDDDSDDEINFITDAKEDSKTEGATQTSQPKRPIPITSDQRKPSSTPLPVLKASPTTTPQPKHSQPVNRQPSTHPPSYHPQHIPSYDDPSNSRPGSSYPARHTSILDLNANPIHPATGKPIFSTDLDTDFQASGSGGSVADGGGGEDTKPWRKPGADITDYFNYGFDEFTWASYCLKKQDMSKEVKEIREGAEGMKSFLEGFGGMPGMPPLPGAGANGVGAPQQQAGGNPAMVGGMSGMPSEAEMQQMFQGMMAQGIDPSTMDPSQFMQMMMGGGGAQGGFGAGQPPSGHTMGGFGGGFDQVGGGGGFQGGGGGGGGRGRGRRGRGNNW